VLSDIAAATKLTSLSLDEVVADSQQAEVVSALTALPDLRQLTWSKVRCGGQLDLTDSMLLQKLTKLTALRLRCINAAEALEHLGLLTRLQDLSLADLVGWPAADCPGLKELKALTRLELLGDLHDVPASVSQLTALQQFDVSKASPAALSGLQGVTGLTQLLVRELTGLSTALQLPALRHLELNDPWSTVATVPMPSLVGSPLLEVLKLSNFDLSQAVGSTGGSLFGGTMLQQLELHLCRVNADGAAGPVSWQQVFPGPGLLPHLTMLKVTGPMPDLQHADMECLVACCSSLQVLGMELHPFPDNVASALTGLSGLTSLTLFEASDQECSSLTPLTGLRELRIINGPYVSAAGLQQLATLEQLTCLRFRALPMFILASHLLQKQVSLEVSEGWCTIINKVCGQGEGFTAPHLPEPLVLQVVGGLKANALQAYLGSVPTPHNPAFVRNITVVH